MKPLPALASAALVCAALAGPASAQQAGPRIGFINTQRVMTESAVAKRVQRDIESEFRARDAELQRLGQRLQAARADLEKNAVTLSETDRRARERDVNELAREFERKQREFGDDLQSRRNEAMGQVIGKANGVIRRIAERDKMDIILQDAVYADPRIDITEKVIKELDAAEPK